MSLLDNIANKVPYSIKRVIGGIIRGERRLRNLNTQAVFTKIYRDNGWGDTQSVSGTGSTLEQTAVLRQKLQRLLSDYHIASMLDIPCGDFHWMKEMDLRGIDYTGADIVEDIIARDNQSFASNNIHFKKLNLLQDALPRVDLILVRDCLVHFSFADIRAALRTICASGSTYLLTTTFSDRKKNADIITGQWRPLNLLQPPFALPAPLRLINEHCTEGRGQFADKCIGLWRIADIARDLEKITA